MFRFGIGSMLVIYYGFGGKSLVSRLALDRRSYCGSLIAVWYRWRLLCVGTCVGVCSSELTNNKHDFEHCNTPKT